MIATSDSLVDRIYEASVIAEYWPAVLADMAAGAEAVLGSLFTFDGKITRWVGTPEAEKLISEYVVGKAPANTRMTRGLARPHPGFRTDLDIFEPAELDRDPFYQDFLRPRGYGWFAGTIIQPPSGDSIAFSVERLLDRGPIERPVVDYLDGLRPHLARAALLSARLGLERAQAMTGALEAVGLPAAALRERGHVLAANPLFESLMPPVVLDRRKRLTLVDAAADVLLGRALDLLDTSPSAASGQVCSIPIAGRDELAPMILHLLPVRRAAHDVFSPATALVVITAVDRKIVPHAEMLAGLFDLTPAEARLAQGIGRGETMEALATAFGVSRETLRTQFKSVLAKTGVNRQAELAALLAGSTLPTVGPR